MYRYERENWARKVKDSYPKRWSTTYGDLNLNAGRHYVHDLGHDPHYVYDREPDSYYVDPDGYRHHHYEMATKSTEARNAGLRRSLVDLHARRHSTDRDYQRRLSTDRDHPSRGHSSNRDHQRRGSPPVVGAKRLNGDYKVKFYIDNVPCKPARFHFVVKFV